MHHTTTGADDYKNFAGYLGDGHKYMPTLLLNFVLSIISSAHLHRGASCC